MADEDELTMNSLLEEAIRGLAANDAARLRYLLSMTEKVKPPRQEQQLLQAVFQKRLLGALLNETARNLRLLQRVQAQAATGQPLESYGRLL